ncbi:hypothetical protein LCGC14_3076670, partial [marine sediment metagenome]
MSITIDEQAGNTSTGTSIDVTFAAIPDDGQMIVLVVFDRGGTEGTGPAGFTKGPSIGTGDWTTMWWKEASSEGSATYAVTAMASDQKGIIGVVLDAGNGWSSTPTASPYA